MEFLIGLALGLATAIVAARVANSAPEGSKRKRAGAIIFGGGGPKPVK